MIDSNDPLPLQAWKTELLPSARFQSEVWQRIADRDSARHSFLEGWLESLLLRLPRPASAVALVALAIGLGLGLGYTAAGNTRSAGLQEGRALYMAAINPLSHSGASLE